MDNTASREGEARWQISRFELIYYNARHRRWQYFAEDPRGANDAGAAFHGEGSHRRQVRRFLGALRNVVERATTDAGSKACGGGTTFGWWRPKDKGVSRITLTHPSGKRFPDWSSHWDEYLKYLIATARFEGLPQVVSEELGVPQQNASNEHSHLVKELGLTSTGIFTVCRQTALSILSLLPILEGWDTWGAFSIARRATWTDERTSVKLPPTRYRTRWFQPFSIAEFTFDEEGREGHSGEILGRTVTLEAVCCDLAQRNPPLVFVTPGDFFEYCRRPLEKDGELYLYRSYGHFFDHITRELSMSELGEHEDAGHRYFVVAYPIQVAGRLHFAQVALTTANRDVTVADLWEDWTPIHEVLWTPECISAFESELSRISLSAFQQAVVNEAKGELRVRSVLSDALLAEVLSRHVFHVLPVRKLSLSTKTWGYENYRGPIPGVSLGSAWTEQAQDTYSVPDEPTVAFNLHLRGVGTIDGLAPRFSNSSLQEALVQNRAVQTIEQQWDYVVGVKSSLEAEAQSQKRDEISAGKIIRRYGDSLVGRTRRAVLNATTGDEQALVLTESVADDLVQTDMPTAPPDGYQSDDRSLRRFLAQAHPGLTTPVQLLDALKERLVPGPVESASILFDSSLVKVATHDYPVEHYFTGDIHDARHELSKDGYLGRTCQTLVEQLQAANHAEMAADLRSSWNEFESIVASMGDVADLRNALDPTKRPDALLAKLRSEWQCHDLPLFDDQGPISARIPCFIKWIWLSLWVDQYRKDIVDYEMTSPTYEDIGLSEATVHGEQLPDRHRGKRQVELRYSAVWLPYAVRWPDRFLAEEKCPNIVEAWKLHMEHFARLCIVFADGRVYEGRHLSPNDGAVVALDAARAYNGVLRLPPTRCDLTGTPLSGLSGQHSRGSLVIVLRRWHAHETGAY